MELKCFWLNSVKTLFFKRWQSVGYAVFITLKKDVRIGFLLFSYFVCLGFHQTLANNVTDTISSKVELSEIEVFERRAEQFLNETGRLVTNLSIEETSSYSVSSVPDMLHLVPGVDIRERGPLGVQSDITIRGGSFDQVMILLNGINITDPQTGHFNLSLPIDYESIKTIEVLRGSAARRYGPNAYSGAINIVTGMSDDANISISGTGGQHGLYSGGARFSHVTDNYNGFFSAYSGGSDGYIENTDFDIFNLYYKGDVALSGDNISFQMGYNEKSYGANSFYSANFPNQFETVSTKFVSLSGDTGGDIKFSPKLYWRRHHDRFELFRDYHNSPEWYTGHNYHLTDVKGASFDFSFNWIFGETTAGGELRGEKIWSNVLGEPMESSLSVPGEDGKYFTHSYSRINNSLFVEHRYRYNNFSLTGGVLLNSNTALGYKTDWYPGLDLSYWINPSMKLMFSYNESVRLPTFTDLFYSSPDIEGNSELKPETASVFESSFRYVDHSFDLQLSGFFRSGRDLIDWGRASGEDIYTTLNINKVNAVGGEFLMSLDFTDIIPNQNLLKSSVISYSYVHQDKKADDEYESRYILDHLRNKLTMTLNHSIGFDNLVAGWSLNYRDRVGYYIDSGDNRIDYTLFLLADLRISWLYNKYNVFLQMKNLFDKEYYDIGELVQPGRWFSFGINASF
ncbi:TonB-dependent receptor [Marinilabiliaceae bacterium ANBcel2]|nr:TonB-dependent receptor [Marinilabiliaceae bacterium ANBcel2]